MPHSYRQDSSPDWVGEEHRGAQFFAFGSTITVNANQANIANVNTVSGNLQVNITGTPRDGWALLFRFGYDGTGGWTLTFSANVVFGTDVTAALLPTDASVKFELLMVYNATTAAWHPVGLSRGF